MAQSELQCVQANSQELGQRALNDARGMETVERVDEELYHDFETPTAKKARS